MDDGSSPSSASAPHVKIKKEGNAAEITIKIPLQNEVDFKLVINGEVPVRQICIDFCEARKKQSSGCLNFKVQTSRAGDYMDMVTKQDAPLRGLFLEFCDQQGLMYGCTMFTFDGLELHEHQTPNELELEDRDVIDVFPRKMIPCSEKWTSHSTSAGAKRKRQ